MEEKDLIEDELCDFCGGTGRVFTDEFGENGNREFGVVVQKCLCQMNFNEDDRDG
jgi:hypothetical protein